MELPWASVLIATSLGSSISRQDGSIDWLDAPSLAPDGFDGAIKATLALMVAFLAVRVCHCKRSIKIAGLE